MARSLFTGPASIVPASAITLSWVGSTPDAAYPIANGETLEPDVVAKAVHATATLRIDLSAPMTLLGLGIINTNWPGLTVPLTNTGGMTTQSIVMDTPADRLAVSAFWNLLGVANTTASRWEIAVTSAPGPVAFGSVVLCVALDAFRFEWGYDGTEEHPVIQKRTGTRKRVQAKVLERFRTLSAKANSAADFTTLRNLRRQAHGSYEPWLLVQEGEAMLVQFVKASWAHRFDEFRGTFRDGSAVGRVLQEFDVEEVANGLPLY